MFGEVHVFHVRAAGKGRGRRAASSQQQEQDEGGDLLLAAAAAGSSRPFQQRHAVLDDSDDDDEPDPVQARIAAERARAQAARQSASASAAAAAEESAPGLSTGWYSVARALTMLLSIPCFRGVCMHGQDCCSMCARVVMQLVHGGDAACAGDGGGGTIDEGPSLMESLLNYGMDSTMDLGAEPGQPDPPSLPAPAAEPRSNPEDLPVPTPSQQHSAPATQGTSATQSVAAATSPGMPKLSLRERMKRIGVIKD